MKAQLAADISSHEQLVAAMTPIQKLKYQERQVDSTLSTNSTTNTMQPQLYSSLLPLEIVLGM